MHSIYITWFLWGFWSKIILITMGLISQLVSYYSSKNVARVISILSLVLYTTNGAIWLAFGSIYRWSQPGQVAAGDKLKVEMSSYEAIDEAVETSGY